MKTAVVGAGVISDIYLENMIHKFTVLDVCAICSRRGDSARKKDEQYGIEAKTFEEILADRSIELVVNLTPPAAHYEIIKALLGAGKNVYTEKVICPDLALTRELAALAAQHNLLLCSAPDTFLGAAIQTARAAVDGGMIGTVTSAVAVDNRDKFLLTEYFPAGNAMGNSMGIDMGIYYVTALVSILGGVTQVCGISKHSGLQHNYQTLRSGQFGEPFVLDEDVMTAGTLLFGSGAVASLHMNAECIYPEKPYLTLYGTQGVLYMADPNNFGGEVRVMTRGNTEAIPLAQDHGFAQNSRGVGVAEMAWSMRLGRVPRTGIALGLHCTETIMGLLESAATQRSYTLQSQYAPAAPLPRGYCTSYLHLNEEAALL